MNLKTRLFYAADPIARLMNLNTNSKYQSSMEMFNKIILKIRYQFMYNIMEDIIPI